VTALPPFPVPQGTPAERKHTPTPWSVKLGHCRHDHPDTSADVVDIEGFPVANTWCHAWAKANAAFIVRACNAHEELVEAVKGLLAPAQRCATCKGQGGYGAYGANPICGHCGGSGEDETPRRNALAVLAKVSR